MWCVDGIGWCDCLMLLFDVCCGCYWLMCCVDVIGWYDVGMWYVKVMGWCYVLLVWFDIVYWCVSCCCVLMLCVDGMVLMIVVDAIVMLLVSVLVWCYMLMVCVDGSVWSDFWMSLFAGIVWCVWCYCLMSCFQWTTLLNSRSNARRQSKFAIVC